jgi:hypothetical protein
MLSLAYPVREYVDQRSRIAALRDTAVEREHRVGELERQLERWNDPAYVKAQARERLHYVMPGETAYVVLEPDEAPAPAAAAPTQTARPEAAQPWYAKLWSSVEGADASAAEPSGTDAGR